MRSGRDRLRLCPNCLGNMGCVPGAIWARTHILGHPTGTGDTARTARTTLSKPLIWKSGLGIYSPKEPTEPGKVSTKKHQKHNSTRYLVSISSDPQFIPFLPCFPAVFVLLKAREGMWAMEDGASVLGSSTWSDTDIPCHWGQELLCFFANFLQGKEGHF